MSRTWEKCGLKFKQTPQKSSLSRYREKVSSDFFRDIYQADLKRHQRSRKTYRGYFIYAIDGDHLDLPASNDILENGYRGFPISKCEETHYPKMYTAQAVDLVNGSVSDFKQSFAISEVILARQIARTLEKKSITIYDRLYDNYETARTHEESGSYFFVRVRAEHSRSPRAIKDFSRDGKRRSAWVDLEPSAPKRRLNYPPIRVRLIKVKNRQRNEEMMFMTNTPEGLIANKDAAEFYQRRWGIESSFKDLTDTLKMCQWHTAKLNGILQEIYALLWLANNVKRLMAARLASRSGKWLERKYKKSNFKLIVGRMMDRLELLIRKRLKEFHEMLAYWIETSTEIREHLSRSYPRQVKRFGKRYRNASRVPRRAAA